MVIPAKITDLGSQVAGGIVAAIGAANGNAHPLIIGAVLVAIPHVVRILETFWASPTHNLTTLISAAEAELPACVDDPAAQAQAQQVAAKLTPAQRQAAAAIIAAGMKKIGT